MLNLHRNKVTFLSVLFLLFTSIAFAQKQRDERILGKNLPGYDNKKMHYGFYLGASAARFNVEHSEEYVQQLPAVVANPKTTPSFTLGFVLSRRLGDYFTARFLPGVGFYNRVIDFEVGGAQEDKEVSS